MPQHSSKNYYKAEMDQNEQDEEKEWQNICHSFFTGHSSHCRWAYECSCRDINWSNAFNTDWTKDIGYVPKRTCKFCKSSCPHISCSCDYCYEMSSWSRINIVKKYFTPEQILEYNNSLPVSELKKYCSKCERIWDVCGWNVLRNYEENICYTQTSYNYDWFNGLSYSYTYCLNKLVPCTPDLIASKKGAYNHILSHSMKPFEVKEINMDMISEKTLDYFMEHHKQNILDYHEQQQQRDRMELLKKYGLTIEEYKSYRLQRQLQIEAQNPQRNPKPHF